ncbi:MAG: Hsp20/alpha crystallin family protein [Thermoplasmata archaeon]|nr:Hsp20/alpha crystallin family protein [Thermoplasmata archaeon]
MNDEKKRKHPFDDSFGFFDREWDRIREMMDMMADRTLRDKGDLEPFVYGFSVRTGPDDGKPVFQRFGDAVGSGESVGNGVSREPLSDIIERGDTISVTVELPGIEKDDIDVDIDGRRMTINVDDQHRRIQKEIELPCGVDGESIKATFRNGVLDVVLNKTEDAKPHKIKIE